MSYIIWSDFFRVGVPFIDKQHHTLIDILNNFYAAYKADIPMKDIFQILNKLTEYAEQHFQDEERLMKAAKYPQEELDYHKKEHEQLILDVFDFNDQLFAGERQVIFNIEVFLNNWLIKHILISDKKYQPFCKLVKNFNPVTA